MPHSNRLVSVKHAIFYTAKHAEGFNPNRIVLEPDSARALSVRASIANISGNPRIFMDTAKRINPLPIIASFFVDIIKAEVSVLEYLNRIAKKHKRPGNREEYVDFIGRYPQHARKARLICVNTNLVTEEGPSLVAFEAKEDHFEATILPYGSKHLFRGDMIIMMK